MSLLVYHHLFMEIFNYGQQAATIDVTSSGWLMTTTARWELSRILGSRKVSFCVRTYQRETFRKTTVNPLKNSRSHKLCNRKQGQPQASRTLLRTCHTFNIFQGVSAFCAGKLQNIFKTFQPNEMSYWRNIKRVHVNCQHDLSDNVA